MKRGQIAIFAIIGILLVASVALIFLLSSSPTINLETSFEPQRYIDSCIRESVRQKVDIMLPQGGFISPRDYKIYNDTRVAYLCKNVNYYQPCITQYPLYISRMEEELEQGLRPDIEQCFFDFEDELTRRNYEFSGSEMEVVAGIKPGNVEVTVEREFSYSRNEESRRFNSLRSYINTPLHDLSMVAQEIAANEAQFCHFEHLGYMVLYPRWDIKRHTMSDSTRIYTITDNQSGAKMNIAIKGCAIPAGF